MNLFYVLMLAHLIIVTVCVENYDENACSVPFHQSRPTSPGINPPRLISDPSNGCRCREFPGEYAFCKSRDSCRILPKILNITTNTLIIWATQIVQLEPGDLSHLQHLENLWIDGNYNLTRIKEGSFLNMTQLRVLSISDNFNLKWLERGIFEGLINLTELILTKNSFVRLADVTLSLRKVPQLRKLDLSENMFHQITKVDFVPLHESPLEELSLTLCQIEKINPQAFNPLTNLKTLRLGENNFNILTISKVIEETINHTHLKTLDLHSIGLRRSFLKTLLSAVAKSNITNLCLAGNQFEVVNSTNFPFMPNLQLLDLSQVSNLNITYDAFVGLPNLKKLVLRGNKLASIPEDVSLEQLTYLDLRENSGSTLPNPYFSIHGQKFTHMRNLEILHLSFNALHSIYNNSFLWLTNLKVLGLKSAKIYNIANGSFAMLPELEVLILENNYFPMKTNGVIDLGTGMFQGLQNVKTLLLGECKITSVNIHSSQGLSKLEYLGLEKNNIAFVDSFQFLPNLIHLNVSNNKLHPWSKRVFAHNLHLRHVNLTFNKIPLLTTAMVDDFVNLTQLELRDNPLTCDCSFSWNHKRIIGLIENQTTRCAFPESSTNLTIQEFLQQDFRCQNLVLVIPLVFLFLLTASTVFIFYYFRWHLRYWLFLTRLYLSRHGKIQNKYQKSYTNYNYDAFVSYSNEDRNFVIRLVTMLETHPPFIKLCVYERDFEVGTLISENILESVTKSRKTLLIISNSYAKSQWCRWESHIAEHHRLFLGNENGDYVDDSLILIKLGPVNETHLTPTLKYLLKTRIYLQWEIEEKKQKVFWEKLRAVLAPPQEIKLNTHM